MVGRSKGFTGHWANHKLEKGNVYKDVQEWIGWDKLQNKVGQVEEKRNQNILRAIFETGGRVSEVIQLQEKNFDVKEKAIRVVDAPLVKNNTLSKRRPFFIPKDEPLVDELLKCIENANKWLFPSKLGKKPFISRQTVHKFIQEKLDLYPHWFRALRAFCLSWEYGLNYEDLITWFTWQDVETAEHYAQHDPKRPARKMGVV